MKKALHVLIGSLVSLSTLGAGGSVSAASRPTPIAELRVVPHTTDGASPSYKINRRRSIEEVTESAQQARYIADSRHLATTRTAAAADPIADCKNESIPDIQKGVVLSHFSYCDRWVQPIDYTVNGKLVGGWEFDVVVAGTGSNGTREIKLDLSIENATSWGNISAAPNPKIQIFNYCYPLLGDIGGCGSTDPRQVTRTLSEWKSIPRATLTMTSPSTVGVGPEKVNYVGWQLYIAAHLSTYQEHKAIEQSARFDSAAYLPKKNGAIFSEVMPHLLYNTSDVAVNETAQHISDACNSPWLTEPKVNNKVVAGCSASKPLHRLYHDSKRRTDNRSAAVATCQSAWPNYSASGNDCDEFPFATTHEGAAQSKYEPGAAANMYSARALNSADNQEAGSRLGVWYGQDRILDWRWRQNQNSVEIRDSFVVWIRP